MQDVTYEDRDLRSFETMLRAAATVLHATRVWVYDEPHYERSYPSEATAFMMSFLDHPPYSSRWAPPDARGPDHYLRVCRLSADDRGEPLEREVATNDVVATAMDLVRRADVAGFRAKTGEGPFAGCDGTVRIGYRLHASPPSGGLHVSLCHIYLSK